MADEVLVKVENVSKKFSKDLKTSLWYGIKDLGSEFLGIRSKKELRKKEFWSVNDVSFELRRGECLGLIGHNGAGKSTLLKMLNGLIKPDKGKITMYGRVGALIELGAGFNPVLTGRENIFINGQILGFSRSEIAEKLDEIIEFAEIQEFIDSPVRNYSSGMKVRLGFSIAAQMEPDVLIIDEVLAVGDAAFRAKCYNTISRLLNRSAVILVSHTMPQVARLCTRSLLLTKGNLAFLGNTPDAINSYYEQQIRKENENIGGSGEIKITKYKLYNNLNENTNSFFYNGRFKLCLSIHSSIKLQSFVINLGFRTVGEDLVAECNNYVIPKLLSLEKNSEYEVEVVIDNFTLNPGIYKMGVILMSENMNTHYDWVRTIDTLKIIGKPASAIQQFQANWKILKNEN